MYNYDANYIHVEPMKRGARCLPPRQRVLQSKRLSAQTRAAGQRNLKGTARIHDVRRYIIPICTSQLQTAQRSRESYLHVQKPLRLYSVYRG